MVSTYLGLDWTPVAISSLCPLDWSTTTWEWQPEKSVIHSGSKYILCYDFYWANLFSFDHWCIDDSVGWELKIYATRSTIESTFIIFNYMYLKCHVFLKKNYLWQLRFVDIIDILNGIHDSRTNRHCPFPQSSAHPRMVVSGTVTFHSLVSPLVVSINT